MKLLEKKKLDDSHLFTLERELERKSLIKKQLLLVTSLGLIYGGIQVFHYFWLLFTKGC